MDENRPEVDKHPGPEAEGAGERVTLAIESADATLRAYACGYSSAIYDLGSIAIMALSIYALVGIFTDASD